MVRPIVELQSVTRVYEDGKRVVRALDGIDLSVQAGGTLALMGRSGSGKSTLLHLIGALEPPSTGSVRVDGVELRLLNDGALTDLRLRRIGFVFQFFHLVPTLTVLENLTLPAELAGLTLRAGRSQARQLAESVKLTDMLDQYPDRLSGGEQQRVAVARSLMLEPPLVLADEPTGNLDSDNGALVLELLFGLARERGATVILATHSEEAARLAARRIVLKDGRIFSDTARGNGLRAESERG
jgi:putative ABC transport system ATP-binding protein